VKNWLKWQNALVSAEEIAKATTTVATYQLGYHPGTTVKR